MARAMRLVGALGLAAMVFGADVPVRAFELEQVGCFPEGTLFADTVLSGDGRTLLFSSSIEHTLGANPLGIAQMVALDLHTREARQLTPGEMVSDPDADTCRANRAVVSHDAGRIVMVAACGEAPEDVRWRLFEHRRGSTRALGRWTRCGPTLRPYSLSVDGRRLVLTAGCDPLRSRVRKRPPFAYTWVQPRPGAAMRRVGPRSCEAMAPALDTARGPMAYLSGCDPRRENPAGSMNLFVRPRPGARPRQLTHARTSVNNRCGRMIQFVEVFRVGLFEPPAIAPHGPVLFAAPCVDGTDPGESLVDRLWRFERRRWRAEEIPLPPCGSANALRAVSSPVAASRGAERMALVRSCVDGDDFRRGEQALIVLRRDGTVTTLLENRGYQPLVRRNIGRPALDAAGSVLAVVSAEPPPGCAGGGTPQLLLARDLDDPVLRRVTCGCGPASPS